MSNFRDVWSGFLIMVFFCMVGVLWSYVGGMLIDQTYYYLQSRNMFPANGSEWANAGDINFIVNLHYGICYFFPILGIALFIRTVIRRQGYDQYVEGW